jgi:hypothetical protein
MLSAAASFVYRYALPDELAGRSFDPLLKWKYYGAYGDIVPDGPPGAAPSHPSAAAEGPPAQGGSREEWP